jgi:hypothetical protein
MSVTKIGEVDLERVKNELFKHEVLRNLEKHSSNQEQHLKYNLQRRSKTSDFSTTGKSLWATNPEGNDFLPYDPDYTENLYRSEMPYVYLLIEEFNLCRTRVLTLQPSTNYSFHQDLTKRIHIPIISNEHCVFIIDDKVWRLPADGSVYLVDTTLLHTAINGNMRKFNRMHLVGSIESDVQDEEE